MNDSNNDDLFSASLESIDSSKRVDKYQRFKNDFQRECNATLDNAQEWIKAELPMVTDYIDAAAVKDELKLSKTSTRRKHLLSSLLFEKSLRESIEHNQANKAAIMAIHMCNHMWQAKVELHGSLPTAVSVRTSTPAEEANNSAIETHNDSRAKILTTLIEKSERLKQDSQIQSQIKAPHHTQTQTQIQAQNQTQTQARARAKTNTSIHKNKDLWAQEAENAKQQNNLSSSKNGKSKKKAGSMFAKVKTRLPLKRRKKAIKQKIDGNSNQAAEYSADDSLLEDPNRSSIMVSPGFSESIDDSLIQARPKFSDDPNESGVTVHKILKDREHQKQAPGSNTIIRKLASSTGKRPGSDLSIPEQCQQAINLLTEQFPGFDKVAIRNMAAKKVGVSPQYIENLNILPEHS